MADALTPYAGLTKPTVGADDNVWGALLNGDLDLIDQFLRNIMPPGVSVDYRGPVTAGPPTGWLYEDGSAVPRSTYSALFQVIGVTYGPGDGATTFNLPDSRGFFSIGVSPGIGAGGTFPLGLKGGALFWTGATDGHVLTLAESPSHGHVVNDPGHAHLMHDPGHGHGVNDPTHNHSLADPTHQHGLQSVMDNLGALTPSGTLAAGSSNLRIAGGPTLAAPTGITIAPVATGISVQGAGTGIVLDGAGTNITLAATGGGSPHSHTLTAIPTIPPYLAANRIIKT
jgi:microcystin-dependent protein